MQTDPIADMLTRIRNANKALHESAEMPSSRLKAEIARLLKEEGYIRDYRIVSSDEFNEKEQDKKKQRPYDTLVIDLKFGRNRERVITDLKRVSKPGRRVYARKDRLPRVLGGMGTAILSTSNGLITSRTAAERGDGGDDRALHGLTRSLIANMVQGVTGGFEKRLEIQGVGYRAALRGTDLELNVGFSHSVVLKAPAGITFDVPTPTEVIVKGIDKQ